MKTSQYGRPMTSSSAFVSGDRERGGVDVLDAAVRAHDREQARDGVRHRVEELDLGAQLGLKAIAAQRQPRRSGHGVEQLRHVVERRVVRDRRDPATVLLDDLHRPTRVRLRLRCRATLRVDPSATRRSLTLIQPVHDGQLVVAQRAREGISERCSALERDDELRNRDGAQERSASMTSPESSPLGTNPRAADVVTSSP